ncbi:hypothetical protein C8Q80DRAFT_1216217 [Daedaleopsis nitida]|nr:hypothetical protein C8Q80DRAFT_1216217 [Daedaleopsis nitida]
MPSYSSRASNPPSHTGAYGLPTPPVDSDDFSKTTALINSADGNFQNYQGKRGVKLLNKAGDTLSVIQTNVTSAQSYASPLQAAMDSDPAKIVRQTITALVDGLPALLRVLDDVAQIHPFIKVAVGAFRTAVELDLKRKDNDKKIPLLFVEMRDMMAVLVQLRDIDKDKRAGEASQTIRDRMENLVAKTEQDIRKCANACSAYAKKRTISKVLHSSSWSDTFKGFIAGFTTRRGEFEFELSLYIGRAVNTANSKLVSIENKMDRLVVFFEACASPEEQYLSRLIRDCGGPKAVLDDELLLRKVYEDKGAAGAFSRPVERGRLGSAASQQSQSGDEFKEALEEVKVDTETAIRDNFERFEQKFIIQQREIEEELRRAMHREGDRVIKAVTSGPHDRIVDPDIHEVWKEMGWRGNVKARHLVLALRDYFREKLDQMKRVKSGLTPTVTRQLSEQDEWALEYVNITRLQPIIEAFDDDASGFITVAEVNTFTTARPDNWSLLHWLAYWAVGYQMVMSEYASKMDVILAKMFSLKAHVLPANRSMVEKYLYMVWDRVTLFTAAFRRTPTTDESLVGRFESYTTAEETRLRRNLETVRYDIDAWDTLELVRGPGRIEKHFFPLIYLLLSRDFEIMRLARTRLLHVDELFDAADTIDWVVVGAYERYTDLSDIFKQQKLDPDQQFKIFGFEMFKYLHNDDDLTSVKSLKERTFTEHEYNDEEEAQDVDASTIINHPLKSVEDLFATHEWIENDDDRQADPAVRAVLGHWAGFCMRDNRAPCQGMIALELHASSAGPKQFQCTGNAANGTNWTVAGELSTDCASGKTVYVFTLTYAARFATQHFRGELDQDGTGALSGSWGFSSNASEQPFTFVFKRLSCENMRFWPSPPALAENKSRALWTFACAAVLSQVRFRMRSWKSLEDRWRTGQSYMGLIIKGEREQLTDEDVEELGRCRRNMTPPEVRLYQIFKDMRERSITVHFDVGCDVCQAEIRGGGSCTTIDLCDKPECYTQKVEPETRADLTSPHTPSHDLFKVRTAIHQIREFGAAHRAAQSALKSARQIFANIENSTASESGGEGVPVNQKPTCIKCGEQVTQPCWYCIECKASEEADVFICNACDTKHSGFTPNKHKAVHALVRVQAVDPAAVAASERAFLDARMNTLEENLREMQYKIEQRFVAADEKMEFVQEKIGVEIGQLKVRVAGLDDRLERIERLLVGIGEQVGGAGEWVGEEHFPRRPVRQQTWAGPDRQERSIGGPRFESEYSAWVRQMRETP